MHRPTLTLALLSLSLTAVACSAAETVGSAGERDDRSQQPFVSACDAPSTIANLQPDTAVDYISRRTERRGSSSWTASIDEEAGTLCGTAKDITACRKKAEELRLLTPVCTGDLSVPGQGCFIYYLLYTRGDDVLVAREDESVNALIGRVDNAHEAMMVASSKGVSTFCDLPAEYVRAEYRERADGFEIVTSAETCTERFKIHVLVGFDQTMTELSRELIPGHGTCGTLEAVAP
jgi:hypothetical protein